MDAELDRIDRNIRKASRLPCLGCSLAVLLSFVSFVGWIWWNEGIPQRKVEKMLADDGPTVGATREEVEAWLDRRGVRHARENLEDSGGYPAEQPPSRFDGLVAGIRDKYVVGKIYASSLHQPAGGEVWIYYFFDSNGRLVQHVVKRWYGWI